MRGPIDNGREAGDLERVHHGKPELRFPRSDWEAFHHSKTCDTVVAVRLALDAGTRRLLGAVPGTRAGDPEGVHQMRVGARRLRGDLRTFRKWIDRDWSEPLRDELQWLGHRLGAVRDLDVLRTRLCHHVGADRAQLEPLFRSLAERAALARKALLDALDSHRFGDLQGQLIAAAREPALRPKAITGSCRVTVHGLVAAAWKALLKSGRSLRPDAPDEALHEVRILAKRTRYAAEAVAPALAPAHHAEALAFAKTIEPLQDVLGEHQDAVIAAREVARIAAPLSHDRAFREATARLIFSQTEAVKAAREQFPKVWNKLDRKKHARWLEV